MRSDELVIITPDQEQCKFHEGEETVLDYYIKNVTDHTIRNIVFKVETLKRDGEKTLGTYATVQSVPKVVLAGKTEKVEVLVKIPMDYNEFYITKDNKKKLSPFKIHALVDADKYLEWD